MPLLPRTLLSAASALALGLAALPANAQGFPDKPIRMIVPWSPGGSTDIIGRTLAARVSQTSGQQVIVENKPGAGGAIGAEQGAKAAADGYTLTIVELTHAGSQALLAKVPYDLTTDFATVAHLGSSPLVLFANAQLKANNFRQLIAASREGNPIPFAIVGAGSVSHLMGESLQMKENARFIFVPYKGGAPAMADLTAGEVKLFFGTLATGSGALKTGRVKAIGIAGARRLAALPEVATAAEEGLSDMVVEQWWALVAPAKTAAPVMEKLKSEFGAALAYASTKERMASLGIEPGSLTPEQFGPFMGAEIRRWNKVAKDANIKIEQ